MAKLTGFTEGQWEHLEGESYLHDTLPRQDKLLKELEEKSDSLPPGQLVGKIISFPVADGAALYRVEKVRPLSLSLIPYGDAYQIPSAHMKGLSLLDIRNRAK